MTSPTDAATHAFARWGHLAVLAMLALAFVTGGGSSDRGLGDVATQLLALPLLLWSSIALHGSPGSRLRCAAVAVALLIVATLAVQQLSLGESLWQSNAVRNALAGDLRSAGVHGAHHAWSLSPLASERSAWSILPALAVFLGALALPVSRHRLLLLGVVALTAFSLLLGYLQLGAPQDSPLNPFPQWAPALNGVFSNPNHQATALALSLAAILSLLLHAGLRDRADALPRWLRVGLALVAALMLASLPLTGSRAAVLLAVLALVVVTATGVRSRLSGQPSPWIARRGMQAALGVLALGAIISAVCWLRVDIDEEVRWRVATTTAAMGTTHAPTGAGVGSFVAWFEQMAPAALMGWEYYNHAHNEYAQWWFESGFAGLAALLGVLLVLALCVPPGSARERMLRGDRAVAIAAWTGCAILLLHSVVDYPLRTPALMTVGGLLAGLAIAQRVANRVPAAADRHDAADDPST